MKKIKNWLLAIIFIPCICIFSACSLTTTYVSPTVTVDEITISNIEKAVNKAVLSVVSIYTEASTLSGKVYSAGAGVIYSIDKQNGDAYIITNQHVLYDESYLTSNHLASKITVEVYGSEGTYVTEENNGKVSITYGPQAMSCEYVGGAVNYDLAILKISNNDLIKDSSVIAATISSSPAHLGQTTIAIGNPLGSGISATNGIVSVESEYIQYSDFYDVVVRSIRTDAGINGGNSGGGLFNEKGELIGIVNAGVDGAENIGAAIPINLAKNVADNIIYGHETSKYNGVNQYDFGLACEANNSVSIFDEATGLTFLKEDIIITQLSNDALKYGLNIGDKVVSVKIDDYELELSRLYELEEFFLKVRSGSKFSITTINSLGSKTFEITASEEYFSIIK